MNSLFSTTCYVAGELETSQVPVIPTTLWESFPENFDWKVCIDTF